jgi:uncharacterized protein YjbI with pentapeptide repeats
MINRILFIIFCVSATGIFVLAQDNSQIKKVEVDSLKIYQVEKLKQEIEQLKSENSSSLIIRNLPVYIGILTALIAVIGAIFSSLKYFDERRNETDQKIQENKLHLEARFDTLINNLGSTSPSIQASAAISLLTFLKPEYKEFHQQVYLILLANLKTDLPENINALLVKTFEKAIRLNIEALQMQKSDKMNTTRSSIELDLTRANLYRIDLHGLDLENVDLAFSNLRSANLDGCNLKRTKGYKTNLSGARLSRSNMTEGRFDEANFEDAQFHETILISAKMKNTNLKGAEFQQAKLQDANLDESEIYGAKFEHANLNNTYLRKIKFRDSDLATLLNAKDDSWEKANFDKDVFAKLTHQALKRRESNTTAQGQATTQGNVNNQMDPTPK